jgi:hypothetical protein
VFSFLHRQLELLIVGYGISLLHHEAAMGANSSPSTQIWSINVTALKSENIKRIIGGILIYRFSYIQNEALK